MHVARVVATATLLPSGEVLVAGGADASGQEMSGAELYDPATGTWTLTGSMNVGRYSHQAQLLGNGKVVVFGGYQQNTMLETPTTELYDPSSGTWTQVGDMNNLHADFFSSLLPDGGVLAGGGCGIAACPGSNTPSAETFDPATAIWTATSDMTAARAAATMTTLPGGDAFVAGGVGGFWDPVLATAETYDPASGSWLAAASMSSPRARPIQALLPTGQVLVAGGWDGSHRSATSEVYDPATNRWQPAGAMNDGRDMTVAVSLADGRVLVSGGFDAANMPTDTAEIFTPTPTYPTSKNQCRHGGWKTFTNPKFKNQGQCIRFVETGN
jgi:hypothetical protein